MAQMTAKIKLWTCPKCARTFRKKGQGHSCSYFPIERHLAGKSRTLYDAFIERMHRKVGDFYIESLPCCIHLVNNAYTFAAVYVMRDKIRLHIVLQQPVKSQRISKIYKASDSRYPSSIDITDEKGLDSQLFDWLAQSYQPSLE